MDDPPITSDIFLDPTRRDILEPIHRGPREMPTRCLAGPRGMNLDQPTEMLTFIGACNPPDTYGPDYQSPLEKFRKPPAQFDMSSRPIWNERKHHNELK
jgi:hypothetical protein